MSESHDVILTSRRAVMTGAVAFVAGSSLGSLATGIAHAAGAPRTAADVAPLPWKWAKLDPLEAGRRAYRFYKEKGGCGTASYLSLLSLLQETVGHPWTTLPDTMMAHAAGGYGGHGTLCGALGGATTIVNLVTFTGQKGDQRSSQFVDGLLSWYAEQEFPSGRFDDLSPLPKQVKVMPRSPLCHTSVSTWVAAAGATVKSDAKIERCAKVAGDVAYTVAVNLNNLFEGTWTPPVWAPAKPIEHCVSCHGPDTTQQKAASWNQQGHQDCLLCHADHTKSPAVYPPR